MPTTIHTKIANRLKAGRRIRVLTSKIAAVVIATTTIVHKAGMVTLISV